MQPINYTGQTYLPPEDGLVRSFGQGMQVRQAYEEAQAKMLERQRAMEMQRQYKADTEAALAKPTPQAFAALALKYPQHREAFKQGWDGLSADAQKNELRDVTQLSAALSSGRSDMALTMIDQRIGTMKAAGEDTASLDMLRQQVETDPQRAYGSLMHIVSGLPGGDKILEGLGKVGTEQRAVAGEQRTAELHPIDVRQKTAAAAGAESDAVTKGVTAKNAETNAMLDLQQKGWNIEALKADIDYKRQSARIAAMNAAVGREGNDLKRQELQMKIDAARSEIDTKAREKTADYQAGHATLQDAMTLIGEIKGNKTGLRGATGASSWGSIVPGTASRDVATKIEQLQNILAAGNLDKLKGPMSDKDIAFLKNISSNLDRGQSEDGFLKELGKVEGAIIRNEKILRERYGASASRPAPTAEPPESRGAGPAPKNRGITVDW